MITRPVLSVALAGVVAALGLAPTGASAASRSGAQAAARSAANRYTNTQLGIGGRARDWEAACLRFSGGGFQCAVVFNGGQCRGGLELTPGLRARLVRIGCVE
jgi:hypothetical protein